MQLDIKVVNQILQEAQNLTLDYKGQFYGLSPEWEFIEGQLRQVISYESI